MARVLAIWCPDWPVAAAGVPATEPVAVLDAGRVLACSLAARAEGVRPGQRRRQAQECCPELELIAHDPDRDARAFEPVLVAVESLTPRIEVLRPGECAFPARGAARYHGGEATLTAKVLDTVDQVLGVLGRCQVGIADGRFAASLAARHAPHPDPTARGGPSTRDLASRASPAGLASRGFAADLASRGPTVDPASRDTAADGLAAGRHWIVPSGETLGFLAPFPVEVLERPELTDLLIRLGLRTLGDLAALPRAPMAARFGPEGIRAHRLATGLDEHPRASRRPPPELGVAAELDPPVTRVDVAAFAAKSLADELVDRLERLGLACTRLRIEVENEHGEMLARVWRHEPPVPWRGSRDCSGPRRFASSACGEVALLPIEWSAWPKASFLAHPMTPPRAAARRPAKVPEPEPPVPVGAPAPAEALESKRAPGRMEPRDPVAPHSPTTLRAPTRRSTPTTSRISAGPLPRTEVLLVRPIPSARQVRASSRPASAQRPAQNIPAPSPVPPSRATLPRRPCPPRQTRRPRQQRPACQTFLPRRSRPAQPNRPQPTRRPRSLCQDCPPRRTRSPPPPPPPPPPRPWV